MGLDQLRVEFDGLSVLGDSLVPLALGPQQSSKVAVGFRVLRFECDGLLVAFDGLVHLPLARRARPRL